MPEQTTYRFGFKELSETANNIVGNPEDLQERVKEWGIDPVCLMEMCDHLALGAVGLSGEPPEDPNELAAWGEKVLILASVAVASGFCLGVAVGQEVGNGGE